MTNDRKHAGYSCVLLFWVSIIYLLLPYVYMSVHNMIIKIVSLMVYLCPIAPPGLKMAVLNYCLETTLTDKAEPVL